ncbi:TonB-dependent receptor [Achromobacter insuavis]
MAVPARGAGPRQRQLGAARQGQPLFRRAVADVAAQRRHLAHPAGQYPARRCRQHHQLFPVARHGHADVVRLHRPRHLRRRAGFQYDAGAPARRGLSVPARLQRHADREPESALHQQHAPIAQGLRRQLGQGQRAPDEPFAAAFRQRAALLGHRQPRAVEAQYRPHEPHAAGGLDYQDTNTSSHSGRGGKASPIDVFDPVYGGFSPATTIVNSLYHTGQMGLYAQDQLEWQRWLLTLGLRHDHYRTSWVQTVQALTKRFGLMYRSEAGLNPYVAYTESFEGNSGVNILGEPYKRCAAISGRPA